MIGKIFFIAVKMATTVYESEKSGDHYITISNKLILNH